MATDNRGRPSERGDKGGGKGKWRPEGRVSDQRKRREPNPDLSDPRQAPWDEHLRAERARRLHRPDKEPVHRPDKPVAAKEPVHGSVKPVAAKEPVRGTDKPVPEEEKPKPLVEEFPGAVYRYSKSPDFTNDELGYGEVISEELWQVKSGKLVRLERRSQRTKTGRQVLEYREDESSRPPDRTPSAS